VVLFAIPAQYNNVHVIIVGSDSEEPHLNSQRRFDSFIMASASAQKESSRADGPPPDEESQALTPSAHAPSVAGSVIEASDGLGGTNYIRIQNISSTGALFYCMCARSSW
jgi:hypothetical protein